jgi:hypothetical protein
MKRIHGGAGSALLGLVAVLALAGLPQDVVRAPGGTLPSRLTDSEFWRLSSSFSEPGGTFHSDNFVSNEGLYQTVIPELLRRAPQGGFYIGVGPEQNFTYIVALRPRMAFIVDIRRGNLHEHLLYKAIFELSASRAEFLARLFSRDVPGGVGRETSVEALFDALDTLPATEAHYRRNLDAVRSQLTSVHRFPLTEEDLAGIDYVYRTAFFADGPELNYRLTGQTRSIGRQSALPTYAELMALDDGAGVQRSYLSTEERFLFLRDLQQRNLVVPVVGDFAGPRALQSVGRYARDHGVTVTAFYLSNVEQYLRQNGRWEAFCANVASMPRDESSTFIRSVRGSTRGRQNGVFTMFSSFLGGIADETRGCESATR